MGPDVYYFLIVGTLVVSALVAGASEVACVLLTLPFLLRLSRSLRRP